MFTVLQRHEVEEQIIDAAVNRLRSRVGQGLALSEIPKQESILRGDAARINPNLPAVWVGDGEVSAGDNSTSLVNSFVLDLYIQSEVHSKVTHEGTRSARRLAALAGDELVRDENDELDLSLGMRNLVYDLSVARSERGPQTAAGVYTHVTVMRVKFRCRR